MKLHRIHVQGDDNFDAMMAIIKEKGYEGMWWPRTVEGICQFDIQLEKDELLFLMLAVPCRLVKT